MCSVCVECVVCVSCVQRTPPQVTVWGTVLELFRRATGQQMEMGTERDIVLGDISVSRPHNTIANTATLVNAKYVQDNIILALYTCRYCT